MEFRTSWNWIIMLLFYGEKTPCYSKSFSSRLDQNHISRKVIKYTIRDKRGNRFLFQLNKTYGIQPTLREFENEQSQISSYLPHILKVPTILEAWVSNLLCTELCILRFSSATETRSNIFPFGCHVLYPLYPHLNLFHMWITIGPNNLNSLWPDSIK